MSRNKRELKKLPEILKLYLRAKKIAEGRGMPASKAFSSEHNIDLGVCWAGRTMGLELYTRKWVTKHSNSGSYWAIPICNCKSKKELLKSLDVRIKILRARIRELKKIYES